MGQRMSLFERQGIENIERHGAMARAMQTMAVAAVSHTGSAILIPGNELQMFGIQSGRRQRDLAVCGKGGEPGQV